MLKFENRCDEIQKTFKENKAYARHEDVDNFIVRLCKILGEGYKNDLIIIRQLYRFSIVKKVVCVQGESQENETEVQQKSSDDPLAKPKQSTKLTPARKEWLDFLRLWIDKSNLFHNEYPRSMHVAFYKLRVHKLAEAIYDYLHEHSSIYRLSKDKHLDEQEFDVSWMKGTFFPSEKRIDPMSLQDREKENLVFFPIDDIITDLLDILKYKEKNRMRTAKRQGNLIVCMYLFLID